MAPSRHLSKASHTEAPMMGPSLTEYKNAVQEGSSFRWSGEEFFLVYNEPILNTYSFPTR